jgi:hypothetical protein
VSKERQSIIKSTQEIKTCSASAIASYYCYEYAAQLCRTIEQNSKHLIGLPREHQFYLQVPMMYQYKPFE